MAEEFANFLQETKKAPLEEKINAFGDIVERMMSVILKIPDLVDQSLATVNQKISSLESRFTTINNEVSSLRTKGVGASSLIAAPSSPSNAPPPSGGPPGGPPPPPGGPPGGPPAVRPASPVSLRGAIMGELKQLFSKRTQS